MIIAHSQKVRYHGYYIKNTWTGLQWAQYYQSVYRVYYAFGFPVWYKKLAKCDRPFIKLIRAAVGS